MLSTDVYSANIRIKEYRDTAMKLNATKIKNNKEAKPNRFARMFGKKSA